MKIIRLSKLISIKRICSITICVGLLLSITASLISKQSGQTGKTAPTATCDCHSNSPSTSTIITVSSSTGSFNFTPGQVVQFNLTVSNSSSSMRSAGCDIGVKSTLAGGTNIGLLAPVTGSGLKLSSGELTHSTPKTLTSGSTTFSFNWTAPTTLGTYYLKAIGMTVNGNGREDSGDLWNHLSTQQLVVANTGVNVITSDSILTFVSDSIGKFVEKKVTVTNKGTNNISINLLSFSGSNPNEFFVVQPMVFPVVIAPNSTSDIIIRYTPTSQNPANSFLNIALEGQTKTIDVALNGKVNIFAFSTSENSLLFECLGIGQPVNKTLTLTNTGTMNFAVTGINITGNSSSVFSFTKPTTFPVTVNQSSFLDILVQYNPPMMATDKALLSIVIEGQTKTIDIPMTGTVTVSDVPSQASNDILSIYPNPAQTDFNLEFNLNESQECNLIVYDMNGIKVGNMNFIGNSGLNKFSWVSSGASKLNSGIYFILLETQSKIQYHRMLVVF